MNTVVKNIYMLAYNYKHSLAKLNINYSSQPTEFTKASKLFKNHNTIRRTLSVVRFI